MAFILLGSQQAFGAFANGDLVLSFQATAGTGATTNVVANLGSGYGWRDKTVNQSAVIDLGALLVSTFGANWYDRTDLWICLNGLYAAGYSPANSGAPVVNGDARNATYVGSVKTDTNAAAYSQYKVTPTALGNVGTQTMTYNATCATALANSDAATIGTSTVNTIKDFTTPAGVNLVNFTLFDSTFVQSFSSGSLFSVGATAYEGALTLQRINRIDSTTGNLSNNVVVPGVNAGEGSNEGFFAIRQNGVVDFYAAPAAQTPTLTATPSSLSGFSTTAGTASASTNFTVTGTALTTNAVVTAPASFEVSTNASTSYSNSLSLTPSAGSIAATTIYVRLAASASAGSPSGNVTVASTSATTQNVAVSGAVLSSYGGWASYYGLNPAVSTGPTAGDMSSDPDKDGFINFREYAFGTSPVAGNQALVSIVPSGSNVVLTYLQKNSGLTIPYVLQTRSSLSTGSWAQPSPIPTPTPTSDQTSLPSGYTRMQFTVPMSGVSMFFQVSVTQ